MIRSRRRCMRVLPCSVLLTGGGLGCAIRTEVHPAGSSPESTGLSLNVLWAQGGCPRGQSTFKDRPVLSLNQVHAAHLISITSMTFFKWIESANAYHRIVVIIYTHMEHTHAHYCVHTTAKCLALSPSAYLFLQRTCIFYICRLVSPTFSIGSGLSLHFCMHALAY
jgi:hypothetical protein